MTKFIRLFISRHDVRIGFCKACKQEAVRFQANNAETIIDHLVKIKTICDENGIDSARMWNLDETGLLRIRPSSGAREFSVNLMCAAITVRRSSAMFPT